MSSLVTRPPILVVEPDLALRTSITYTLRKEGHLVLALGDSRVACEIARDNPLSLIILDPVQIDVDELALCQVIPFQPTDRACADCAVAHTRTGDYPGRASEAANKQERPPRRARSGPRTPSTTLPLEESV